MKNKMTKTLLISSLLLSTLCARENPFRAVSENPENSISSQKTPHKPPLQSMTYNFPDQARILKEVTFKIQNLDGTYETRRLEIDQSIDWRSPLVISQSMPSKSSSQTAKNTQNAADSSFVNIVNSANQITLSTAAPMIRHFTLSDPNSIAIDFKYTAIFDSYEKPIHAAPFIKAKVNNHGKFARVIIVLDGKHQCKVSSIAQGAQIVCK